MIRFDPTTASSTPETFHNQTVLEPLVLAATLVLGVLVIILPRRFAVVPFILLASFLPVAQRLVIAGIDLPMIRVLLLFGWTRLLLRGDLRGFRWGALDTAFFAWVTIASIVWIIARLDFDAVIQRAGTAYGMVGLYFLFRCWVRDLASVRIAVIAGAVSAFAVSAFMALEFTTGRNLFSVFGSVPDFTVVRDGRLRCQGTFPHPIMAGSAGAALAPLCLWLLVQKGRGRWIGGLGFVGATGMVVFSSSSGPLLGWLAGMGACSLWFVRDYMFAIRWGTVGLILALHLVMNRPVWHLIGHLNVVGGSTAYHRVRLIDSAVREFPNWALLGTPSTEAWGWGLGDVTNQFILEGVRGGFASLVAMTLVLVFAFRYIGIALRRLDETPATRSRRSAQMLAWSVGAGVFVHAVNFFGVSYFGQIELFLMMNFAMAAAVRKTATQQTKEPRRPRRSQRVRALLRPTTA